LNAIPTSAPLPRRLIAVLYDAIAAFTVVYFASFAPVLAVGSTIVSGNPLFTLYAAGVLFGYFGLCWTRGRTLGMQAWKLAIVSSRTAQPPSWREAAVRFGGAAVSLGCGGLGYLAALFDAEGRTWHDRWSHTRIVRQPPRA